MARLTIGPVRLSYLYIFEPRPAQQGQKAKYGASLLIPKTATQTLAKIQQAIQETRNDYKGKSPKAGWVDNAKTTLYDGDGFRPGGEPFGAEAKGHYVLGTSSIKQPMVVDASRNPILDHSQVYSGAFGLAVISFYVYDSAGNKGIACGLDGIMKTGDGSPLSGYQVTDRDWDNVAADDLAQLNAMLS